MACFQVKLGGEWKDYSKDEDKILKRAYLAGFQNASYTLRGQKYSVDFRNMRQTNGASGKDRDMRPPNKLRAPAKPLCPAGPTMCIKVPAGTPGTTIQVPHPKCKGLLIDVSVPASAKVGQAMLVPIPERPAAKSSAPEVVPAVAAPTKATAAVAAAAPKLAEVSAAEAAPAPVQAEAKAAKAGKSGWSTGAKVAVGASSALVVGGLAVGGALLGEHVSEVGWDATMAELGDDFSTIGHEIADVAVVAGHGIATGAEDAVHWVDGAAHDVGSTIMDLF